MTRQSDLTENLALGHAWVQFSRYAESAQEESQGNSWGLAILEEHILVA